jgi:predicted TIM-barrel fold metal-dependent hydrolase
VTQGPLLDCCVRAIPRAPADIVRRLPQHFRWTELGHPLGHRFVAPQPDRGLDAQDRDAVAERVLGEWGALAAIVLPPAYPLRPDVRLEVALARAINEWLADEWLRGGFFGSICVSAADPGGAVREIERWADDPRFVQVTVPLHAHAPYGEERYVEIWQAAAAHRLPVCIRSGGGGGVEHPASMSGELTRFLDYHTLLPLTAALHVVSLISEGVFERVPELTVVLADGGIGTLPPLIWREDAKARALRDQMPWLRAAPSDHLRDRVRFVTRRADVPAEPESLATMLEVGAAARTLIFGSNTPMWDALAPGEWEGERTRVLAGTAFATYPRLRAALTTAPA